MNFQRYTRGFRKKLMGVAYLALLMGFLLGSMVLPHNAYAQDISTLVYDGVSKDFGVAGVGRVYGSTFSADGTKMYILSDDEEKVAQWNLSTPWDLSSASYDGLSVDIRTLCTSSPYGSIYFNYLYDIAVNPDGSKMYILASNGNKVYQFSLTDGDKDTISYDGVNYNFVAPASHPRSIFFKPDGTKMYVGCVGTDAVYQYSLSSAWDVSTASYNCSTGSDGIDTPTKTNPDPYALFITADGMTVYTGDMYHHLLHQYSLSIAWDISTISWVRTMDPSPTPDVGVPGVYLSADGSKMFLADHPG
nr:hypothetical protein [Dehalococcoidia bacterium]